MRILFVTPYVPSSVRIRPLAFIRELAQRGHHVTLCCLVQPEWEANYLSEVAPFCEALHPVHLQRYEPFVQVATALAKPTPLSVAYCESDHFKSTVERLVQEGQFDIVHTEFVRAAPTTMNLAHEAKIFDFVDCMSLAYRRSIRAAHVPWKQRVIGAIEWGKMRSYEKKLLGFYKQTIISSPIDRNEFGAEKSVEILPNGVDLDYYAYTNNKSQNCEIIFLGKMSYYVNVASVLWFYKEVFPFIRRRCGDVKFLIVGRNPIPAIRNLANDPAVEVTGTVPDVRPYLQRSSLAICPMVSGAGIQNKMLEAMAVGTPCVATSLACQALEIEPEIEVLIADKAESFANSVLELLENPTRRKKISEAARNYTEKFHDWKLIGARLESLYLNWI